MNGYRPIHLERWEVQVLMLLAEDPKNIEAEEVYSEYEKEFSSHGRNIAKIILNKMKGKMRFAKMASIFLKRAKARVII